MNRSRQLRYILVFLILALTVAALSVTHAASLISYQGRLTTDSGQPVADGAYNVQFAIYSDSTGGSQFWQETALIQTQSGLFSHLLGSVVPFPRNLFANHPELFLELTVDGEVVAPRSRLTASAYAMSSGNLRVTDDIDSTVIFTDGQLHRLVINGSDSRQRMVLSGEEYGRLQLYDSIGTGVTADLSATADSGGRLSLYNLEGDSRISLRAGLEGDLTVQLPDSAINADEILNETGIVTTVNTNQVPLATGVMTDLVTIDLTIPEDGYIHLRGKCYVLLSGTTGPNNALVQIDFNEGGGSDFPYYQLAGLSGYVNTGTNYFPIYVERTYFAQAGTYTFRMEGRAEHPLPAVAKTWDHILTATYYPTYYGAVSSVVRSPEGHPSAVPLDDPRSDSLGQRWKVDLRESLKSDQ